MTLLPRRPDPEVWRRVKPDALHVTLAFLGSRPASDVDLIKPLIVAAPRHRSSPSERCCCCRPAGPASSPWSSKTRPARWRELQARVSAGLEAAGVYTPEKRPFRPHVTIARLRPRVRAPRAAALEVEPLEFAGQAVTLYVSRLHPSGARYEALATRRFGH